jgi:methionyl-tRNA formyltransferase
VSSVERTFVWCTYRDWSFRILEGLIDLPGWRVGLVVTTPDCRYRVAALQGRGVTVLRGDPTLTLSREGEGFRRIVALGPSAIFHYGWSWRVPEELLALCPNMTLHPGKLPKDRGGSPLQNQIRNGETWSYANVMELSKGLDEGPVYARRKFSLEGQIDEVWSRMTAVGCALTREFLRKIASDNAVPTPQADEPPTLYKRVRPADAVLRPEEQTARKMYDIIRAHAETDPNTYVVPASLLVGTHRLVIHQATLVPPGEGEAVVLNEPGFSGDLHELCAQAVNGEVRLAVRDPLGNDVYLTRLYVGL